jgi:hypothetical protein
MRFFIKSGSKGNAALGVNLAKVSIQQIKRRAAFPIFDTKFAAFVETLILGSIKI